MLSLAPKSINLQIFLLFWKWNSNMTKQKQFPRWDWLVPNVGLRQSQCGTKMVPAWEWMLVHWHLFYRKIKSFWVKSIYNWKRICNFASSIADTSLKRRCSHEVWIPECRVAVWLLRKYNKRLLLFGILLNLPHSKSTQEPKSKLQALMR